MKTQEIKGIESWTTWLLFMFLMQFHKVCTHVKLLIEKAYNKLDYGRRIFKCRKPVM
jgi:hypothetical protein